MALHDRIQELRDLATRDGRPAVQNVLRGVTKDRIAEVLARIDRNHPDMVDAVFALLDDQPTWFSKAPVGARFCDGASTAHVACHVGILQRGRGKLDREGRDYWLKPLWEIGAIEKVFLDKDTRTIVAGHPVAKSQNSAYRLADSFVEILAAPADRWPAMLDTWVSADAVRGRLELQARLAHEAANAVGSKHQRLINNIVEVYAPRFLPGFEVLYVDDSDGDRISDEEKERLLDAGIVLQLGDAVPDVLLWHRERNELWVVEAVTSDGEVDLHKINQMQALAKRTGKAEVGFTTVYPTWSVAAARQGRYKNIPPETYIWIAEDPSKQLKVS